MRSRKLMKNSRCRHSIPATDIRRKYQRDFDPLTGKDDPFLSTQWIAILPCTPITRYDGFLMRGFPTVRHTFLAVLFIGLFALTARNVTDPDVWWHLETGQYIAEHKSVPHADPFSYTRAGAPWVAHEWLTDLLLYELLHTTGFGGLIIVFAMVLCAACFMLFLRCGPDPYFAGVAMLYAAGATEPVWGVRPQVLSLLLTSLWLLILERSERNPKIDRKSTRLNSSHRCISYAVFCL